MGQLKEAVAGGGADWEDGLALREDLQGKLDRSEAHRQEVAKKLGKARKHQQNLLSQYEAEIAHLADKERAAVQPYSRAAVQPCNCATV